MNQRHDVVVIGAGIVGVSTALHLLMRGRKVLLIDRKEPGRETSYGNAGILETACVLPFSFPPLLRWPNIILNRDPMARIDYPSLPQSLPWIIKFFFESQPKNMRKNGHLLWPLLSKSVEEHFALMKGTTAEKHWKPSGRIALYRTKAGFEASQFYRDVAQEMGVPFEVADGADIREIEPHLKPNYYKAIRWTGTSRIDNPRALVSAYAGKFASEGGTIQQGTVKKIEQIKDGWQLETVRGAFTAKDLVICTGPWAAEMLKPLGYDFPLGFKRGYHRHYAALGAASLSHSITDVDNGYVLVRMEQGYRITTGAEFANLNAPPNPAQLSYIVPKVRELFPLGEPLEATPWHGSRPCFADSLPVIGPAARHKGLWFNFGHGHVGLTIGPASGRLLAEILTDSAAFCDPHPYRAGRFGC